MGNDDVPNRMPIGRMPSVVEEPSATVIGLINGFDVSSANSVQPGGFLKAFQAGFRFAYIQSSRYSRIAEGSFHRTLQALQDSGFTVGAYHFCSHDTDPAKQMEFFYRASGGLGSNPGELPPMLDWEFCTPQKYPDHPQHCINWLDTAVNHAEELWYPGNDRRQLQGLTRRMPVIYTYPNYSNMHQPGLGQALQLGTRPLCFASYTAGPNLQLACTIPYQKVPAPWAKATLVQHKGNEGRVPGINGACDMDVFLGPSGNGTEEEWRVFLGY